MDCELLFSGILWYNNTLGGKGLLSAWWNAMHYADNMYAADDQV